MNGITVSLQYYRRQDGELDKSPCWEASIKLFNKGLGEGYLSQNNEMEFLDTRSHSALYAASTESVPAECVGSVLIAELSRTEIVEYATTMANSRTSPLLQYRRIGLLKSLVVASRYQRKGIGKILTLNAIQQCRRWGCEAVLTIAWLPADDRHSSLSMFKKLGFNVLAVVSNYWQRSSETEKFKCPACGDPPCCCDAAFLLFVLNNPS